MESGRDFIQWLGHDLSMKILTSLENPSDIIRFSAVSTSWFGFAVANGLSKKLCLNKFPEFSKIPNIIKEENKIQVLEKDHKVYAYLARGLANSYTNICISNAISVSSTNNYPEESLQNTLEPRDMVGLRASYWSSTGQTDPTVPEKLTYNLISYICIVTEIHVQPFQECSENGFSVYSPRAVRFKMGHPKFPIERGSYGSYKYEASLKYDDSAFSWNYISPEFAMAQENRLQMFKLPEPVFCIGGILQMELLGRVQTQESDDLYYIRITHVQVVGRPISPGFEVEFIDSWGRCKLNYYSGVKYRFSPRKTKVVTSRFSKFRKAFKFEREGEQFVSTSMFRSGLAIHFLVMAFICIFFLMKLSKVPLCLTYSS